MKERSLHNSSAGLFNPKILKIVIQHTKINLRKTNHSHNHFHYPRQQRIHNGTVVKTISNKKFQIEGRCRF